MADRSPAGPAAPSTTGTAAALDDSAASTTNTTAGRAARPPSRYLLLMRHGERNRENPDLAESKQPLTAEGAARAAEVAAALREIAAGEGGVNKVVIGRIFHGSHKVTTGTAETVAPKRAVPIPLEPDARLDPQTFYSDGDRKSASAKNKELVAFLYHEVWKLPADGGALLVVGHQPQLGWIAEALTGEAEPIGGCELLCIEIRQPPAGGERRDGLPPREACRLTWILTPGAINRDVLPALKEKIASKMKVAELLGVVIVGVLSWLLTLAFDADNRGLVAASFWTSVLFGLSLAAFGVALALYVMTIFAYDELLMPDRYWSEGLDEPRRMVRALRWLAGGSGVSGGSLARPPTSASRLLHRNMIRAWSALFVPATCAVAAGLALLALAGVAVHAQKGNPPLLAGWVLTPAVVAIVAWICVRAWFRGQPRMGTQD